LPRAVLQRAPAGTLAGSHLHHGRVEAQRGAVVGRGVQQGRLVVELRGGGAQVGEDACEVIAVGVQQGRLIVELRGGGAHGLAQAVVLILRAGAWDLIGVKVGRKGQVERLWNTAPVRRYRSVGPHRKAARAPAGTGSAPGWR
jgi:hypothetical protein